MAVFLRPFASRAMVATCSVGAMTMTRAFSPKHEQPQTELSNATQMQRRIPGFNAHTQTPKLSSVHTSFESTSADKTKAYITNRSPFVTEAQRLGLSQPSKKYTGLDSLVQAVATVVEKALLKAAKNAPCGISERDLQIELNSELLKTFKIAHKDTRFAQYYLPSDIRTQINPKGVKVFSSIT